MYNLWLCPGVKYPYLVGDEAALSTHAEFSQNEKQTPVENPGKQCHFLFLEMGEKKKVVESVVTNSRTAHHECEIKQHPLTLVGEWMEGETIGKSWHSCVRGHWPPKRGNEAWVTSPYKIDLHPNSSPTSEIILNLGKQWIHGGIKTRPQGAPWH